MPGKSPENLKYVAAPLVNASDLPWRLLVARHGTSLVHTQMIMADQWSGPYRQRHLEDLRLGSTLLNRPMTFVQLGASDVASAVSVARELAQYCDGFDLNMGCPQELITINGCGSALLHPSQWDQACNIITGLRTATNLPVSAKLRLCSPLTATVDLGKRLEEAGATHLSLHGRFPSARARRKGPAYLDTVYDLVQAVDIPVISNGNTRTFADVCNNLEYTEAAGIMSGVGLLRNPCLFEGAVPDPVAVSIEYLDICRQFPQDLVAFDIMKRHVLYNLEREDLAKPEAGRMAKLVSPCHDQDALEAALLKLHVK